jgi:NitT/TauT family transport system substrate-binding protein
MAHVCLAAAVIASGLAWQVGTAVHAAKLQQVTIAMGYIPNVQFAPYYVAAQQGYYAAAGLDVHFNYSTATDVMKLVGTGSIAFGNAEADQVIVARARGLPDISVFTQYQRFPVVIFALRSSGIRSFADLKGKTIGLPGLYGASYTGLLAALAAAHLTTSDVHLEAIGYSQVAEVAQHRVDAAVGYVMNEPVQLQQQGYPVTVLPIADLVPLGGPGIVTSTALIKSNPDLVKRFVQATYKGQLYTDAHATEAFAISRRYLPSLAANTVAYQQAVLRVAIGYWVPSPGHKLGCTTLQVWKVTQQILLTQRQISSTFDPSALYTNQFVPGC